MKFFSTQLNGESHWKAGPPDEVIVARVIAGETNLFEVLMRRYNQRLFRAVRPLLKVESEVEEVMQQTYVEAYTHLRQLTEAGCFSRWLVRIGVNESFVRLRQRQHLVAAGVGGERMGSAQRVSDDPEEAASRLERARLLEAALEQLSPRYRLVFVLREVEGMSTRDTALALGVSKDVVKTRLRRSKLLLRRQVGSRSYAARARALPFHATRCNRVVVAVLCRIVRLAAWERKSGQVDVRPARNELR
jgi:RNA polymerase sigma-70 factor (ECF subfamily)